MRGDYVRFLIAGLAILGLVWLGLITWQVTKIPEAFEVLLDRLAVLAWFLLVMICATAGGAGALARLRCLPRAETPALVFSAAVGLGASSLGVLLLGVCGLVSPWLLIPALIGFGLSGRRQAVKLWRETAQSVQALTSSITIGKTIWAILFVFFLLNLTRAFEPPLEYDSLEYHLGAPAIWHREGRITFLRDNVYSNMPFNTEMLYFLGMQLRNDPVEGAVLGKLFNAAAAFLTAIALRTWLRRMHSDLAGDFAAGIYYTWPGVALYSGIAFVELFQQFYGIMAVWAAAEFALRGGDERLRKTWLLLAGAMSGLGVGVKYPGALFVFLPVAIIIAAADLARKAPVRRLARDVALVAVVALALWGPWLVRNLVNTGNPTYPLLYSVFGGSNWDGLREARWQRQHSPGPITWQAIADGFGGFFMTAQVTVGRIRTASELLFLFIPLLVFSRRWHLPLVLGLLAYAVFILAVWFLTTHRADRFLSPVIPALAALSGAGLAALCLRRFRRVGGLLLIAFLIVWPAWVRPTYPLYLRSLPSFLGAEPEEVLPENLYAFWAARFLSQMTPKDAKIAYFIEAQTFWCRRDVVANTPFDRGLIDRLVASAETPADVAKGLHEAGVTHVLISGSEISRLRKTPGFEYKGRKYSHILHDFNWPLFWGFVQRYLQQRKAFPSRDKPVVVIYRLRPSATMQ